MIISTLDVLLAHEKSADACELKKNVCVYAFGDCDFQIFTLFFSIVNLVCNSFLDIQSYLLGIDLGNFYST